MGKVESLWSRITRWTAIDAHVLATLVLRLWSLTAGAITVLLIPLCLSAREQGYYFTFASVLALQIFFDLGFNQVLVQFVGKHMSALKWQGGFLVGDSITLQRLGLLVKGVTSAYRYLALAFALSVGGLGAYFFDRFDQTPPSGWLISWLLLTLATAGNLYMSPQLAMAEGTGQVQQVARIRTIQSVVGYSLAWIGLGLGWGLMAIPFIAAVNLAGTIYWAHARGRFLNTLVQSLPEPCLPEAKIRWREDILPFQWRMAISWMSGYLIFQLFNPMLFAHHGPIDAGRVGLALALFNAVVTLAMSWINAKSPVFAQLLGNGQQAQARELFKKQFAISSAANFALCLTLPALAWFGNTWHMPLVDRMPTMSVLACLAAVTISNQIVFGLAVYMRAHGREPLVWPSLVTGMATLGAVALTARDSILDTMMAYAGVQILICLPWVVSIFVKDYWTSPPTEMPIR